jgi:adenosylcobinamide kinase/adenosylcobinamide-phosphate guanylyltransferase
MVTLITGGVKSGKSRRALDLALRWISGASGGGAESGVTSGAAGSVSFIATAEALDDEMRGRIERHKAERAGHNFTTIEEPLDIAGALSRSGECVLVDCITMWVNNLLYHGREADFERLLAAFVEGFAGKRELVIVSNETGLGNIPLDALTRRYNLLVAEANRRIACAADIVEFMVAGLPIVVKQCPAYL